MEGDNIMKKSINSIFVFMVMVLLTGTMLFATTKDVNAASLKKVKKIKASIEYRFYNGPYSSTEGETGKIKYAYGIKYSWKKVKGATGYEVRAYGYASKKWRKIKTTSKNYFTLTNLLSKDKVKIKIRAYRKKGNKKSYGKWSGTKTVTAANIYTKYGNNGTRKAFIDRYAAENAFVQQNKLRKEADVKKIKWSNVAYEICVKRAKEISEDFSHDKFNSTSLAHLKSKYGIDDLWYHYREGNTIYSVMLVGGENIAMGHTDYKAVIEGWKNSPGHYANIICEDYKSGAIACYSCSSGTYWVAIFSDLDMDKTVKQLSK